MYAYVGNNPLAYLDPDGLEAVILGYFWRTDWLPTGQGFAAGDLLAASGGAVGGITMGEPEESTYEKFSRPYKPGMNNAANLVLGDAGVSAPMCPLACFSEYRSDSHGYFIIADITTDLSSSKKSTATISEALDPSTGQATKTGVGPTRWWSDVSGGPASTYDKIYISNILSTLSDADLQAVATALENAVIQDGLDLALWDAEIAVEQEILRRKKEQEDKDGGSQDDNIGK